ncbi:MAG: Gfo/Idh/MocA family protein [Dissulfurispiraceae bacterium]
MTQSTFNVLVIGAGAIGALYDTPESEFILTHAHAFSTHPGFNLLGFADTNHERAQNAALLWNCEAFGSIAEAFQKNKVDVVCVAVPDELHYELLKTIVAMPLKAVFTEKPLTKTVGEAKEIVELYTERAIPVCVNYRRCFVPEFESLRDKIRGESFGKYLTGTGYYGKGFLHNGSHLINLLSFLIGEIVSHQIVDSEIDFYPDDPAISTRITFDNNKPFNLYHINCFHYTIFEVDLLFEAGRVRITDTGFKIEYHTVIENTVYKDYNFLMKTGEINTQLGRSLYHSADNIYNHLTNGEQLKCTLHDAFKTMQICESIKADLICRHLET